jgi:hypothetical protein
MKRIWRMGSQYTFSLFHHQEIPIFKQKGAKFQRLQGIYTDPNNFLRGFILCKTRYSRTKVKDSRLGILLLS